MTGRAGAMTATVSTLTDPVSSVGSLVELIRADCADIDATRKVPTAVIGGLQDAVSSGCWHRWRSAGARWTR